MISRIFHYNCSLLVSKGKLKVQAEVGIKSEKLVTTGEMYTEICLPHEMMTM
jgi:hypothetical protein